MLKCSWVPTTSGPSARAGHPRCDNLSFRRLKIYCRSSWCALGQRAIRNPDGRWLGYVVPPGESSRGAGFPDRSCMCDKPNGGPRSELTTVPFVALPACVRHTETSHDLQRCAANIGPSRSHGQPSGSPTPRHAVLARPDRSVPARGADRRQVACFGATAGSVPARPGIAVASRSSAGHVSLVRHLLRIGRRTAGIERLLPGTRGRCIGGRQEADDLRPQRWIRSVLGTPVAAVCAGSGRCDRRVGRQTEVPGWNVFDTRLDTRLDTRDLYR